MDCACRTKTGKIRDTLLWAELLNVGAEPCVLLIIEDVTERRMLENQLHQAQKMEAIGQLATGIAHDFNNILTVIQGHVELLLMSANFEQKAAKSLEQVSRASSRAAELTRQLLTFCRKQAAQPKVVDLSNQFQSVKGMLRRLLGEQHSIAMRMCAGCAERVGGPGQHRANHHEPCRQRARCHAARRHADHHRHSHSDRRDPRELHPDARTGDHVCLSVIDTGCGIKADVLSRIFEPFFTTKQMGKGAGLGLAIVYGLVKQLNGWIEVTSEFGKGSTFKVYLPAHDGGPSGADSRTGDRRSPQSAHPPSSWWKMKTLCGN